MSVLCTTHPQPEGARNALTFKLLGNLDDLGVWGHEYLRHLAGEIGEEYGVRVAAEKPVEVGGEEGRGKEGREGGWGGERGGRR